MRRARKIQSRRRSTQTKPPVHPWSARSCEEIFGRCEFREAAGQKSAQNLQIAGRHLAASLVGGEIETHLLTFLQIVDASALKRTDVHERVFAAVIRRNKTVALIGIEPLYGSRRHRKPFRKHR